jgi:hypothetical protein
MQSCCSPGSNSPPVTFGGPFFPGFLARPEFINLIPEIKGLRFQVVHSYDVGTSRARQELSWMPQRSAEDTVLDLLAGLREGAGLDTPTLSPKIGDPNLTLTRTQYPAIVGNRENRSPFTYARFASVCNPQQPLTAHS